MRHLATYLLLVAGGNASPSAADVTAALSAVGIEADQERLNQLIADLAGKDIEELIAEGKKSLVKFGGGGAPAAAASAAPAAGAAPAAEKPKEKPKVEEVDALEGGMDMFGGGGGGGDY
jgi:ribosomal protein L12E/L44/L45/RPP1/RPP2